MREAQFAVRLDFSEASRRTSVFPTEVQLDMTSKGKK